MIWVGVTGGMGCGKSTAVDFFQQLGFGVVSADQVVHDLYKSPAVVSEVSKILNISLSNFSKKKVAELVFQDKQKLKLLESYLHPLVRAKTEKRKKELSNSGLSMAFYEVEKFVVQ